MKEETPGFEAGGERGERTAETLDYQKQFVHPVPSLWAVP